MNFSCSNQDPCPVILDSKCVIYEGENLVYIGVNTNDNLRVALQKINTTIENLVLFGAGIIELTGDVLATGPGITPATLATVNATPGQFGSSTAIPKITVDGKGRITAISTDPVFIPSGSLSFIGDVTGTGNTGSNTTLTLATVNSNVYTGNTFLKFAVNGKGLVTSATGVGSSDIISALGYTPYDAANPANYISRLGLSAIAPLGYNNTNGQFSIQQADATHNGYISSTDWNTFNNKQAAGNYITDLNGEATAAGPGVASVTLNNAAVTGKVLTGLNITGGSVAAADSILTAFGKVQNQINGLIGGSIYQGVWDASTNTPALASGVGTKGYYYIVNVAGSTNLDGITDWNLGDWAIFDGTAWQQVDNTDAVVSVNGFTGAVSLTTDNISEGLTNQYFTTSRARLAISGGTGISYDNVTGIITNTLDLSGYVPTSRTLTINGTTYDLSADRTWTLTGFLPAGGTAGQILAKIDGTDYNAEWIDNYSTQVKNIVKLGAALTKGTPVYITSADGTNMIVNAAGNQSEATSSKTFGLLETGGALNDQVKVVTYGLLAGLDTSAAGSAGDPVWLGPNGTLLYGLVNKPYAPAHMVYIGVVTRKQQNNGEIFVNVQNGFEMDELHNVSAQNPANNAILAYSTSTSLWEKNTIAGVLGYTPANDASVVHLTGNETINGFKTFVEKVDFNQGLNLKHGSGAYLEAGYSSITSDAGGWFFTLPSGTHAYISQALLTNPRNFTLPDNSGTFALTSDIPSLAGYVQGTGTANYIPVWNSTTGIANSTITDSGSGNIMINEVSPTNYTTLEMFAQTESRIFLHSTNSDYLALYNSYGQVALRYFGSTHSNTLIRYTGYNTHILTLQTDGNDRITVSNTGTFRLNAYTTDGLIKTINSDGTFAMAVAGTDYVAPSALSGYLPLSGGTLTGGVTGTGLTLNNYLTAYSPSNIFYGTQIYGTSGGARKIFVVGQQGYAEGFTVDYTGSVFNYGFNGGNVGIGITPQGAGTAKTLEIGSRGMIYDNNDNFLFGNNGWVDSGTWKYKQTGKAMIMATNQGEVTISTAVSGTQNTAITWNDRLRITNGGNLLLGGVGNDAQPWMNTGLKIEGSRPGIDLVNNGGGTLNTMRWYGGVAGRELHMNFDTASAMWVLRFNSYYLSGGAASHEFFGSGNLTIAGILTENSSIRYKKNIEDLLVSPENIFNLRPVSYIKKETGLAEIGLIAEEVETLIPQLVNFDKEGRADGVNYTRLSVVLLAGFKYLKEELDKIKAK